MSYNLQQLQDIPFQDLLDSNNLLPNDKVAMIKFYVGSVSVFGQYKIKGAGNQNQISFNQRNFISDDKKRLNYLSKMINDTTAIKAFNGSYRKFLMMGPSIPGVRFIKSDFPTENLVKEIYDDSNVFVKNKVNILENLKKNFIGDYKIKSIFNLMPTVFDDFDIDVSLIKAVLTTEIKADAAMNYVYGSDSRTYYRNMLVVNIQTTLKMGNIISDITIDEELALHILYS